MSDQLYKGVEQLGIALSTEQYEKLLAYIALLAKWNRAYNLTAIKKPEAMITHHLLDSLVLAPYFDGFGLQNDEAVLSKKVIDVGTGAGLPGVPLSIVLPKHQFTLLDGNGKKSRFLIQAKIELGLDNCLPVNERIENYQPNEKYDIVMSRAFASLTDFFTLSGHLLKKEGYFWAMKGKYPTSELEQLTSDYNVIHTHTLSVPYVNEDRHLFIAKHQ